MSKQEKEKILVKLIICPHCNGNKITDDKTKCPDCQGLGVFLMVGKRGIYYWKEKLAGFSPLTRHLYAIFPKAVRLIIFLLALFAFLYGIYFVFINNSDFLSLFKEDIIEEKGRTIIEFWFIVIASFIYRSLETLFVLVEKRGTGPLMFWLATSGAIYFYSYHKLKDVAKKSIDLSLPEFEMFYNKKAAGPKDPVNIANYTSPSAKNILLAALDIAHSQKQSPSPYHLAKTLLENSKMKILFKRLEVDTKQFAKNIDVAINNLPKNRSYEQDGFLGGTIMNPELERMAIIAFEETLIVGLNKIEPESLFLALFQNEALNKYFKNIDVELEDARNTVLWVRSWSSARIRMKKPRKIQHTVMNRAWTARVTPELDRFSYDLTDHARSGLTGHIVNRKKELDNLMRILERTSQNNALLIGEEGVGKTTIVKALANKMIRDQVLPTLQDKRLVVLDIGALVSGARAGGDLELRIRKLLEDMGKSGNIILYIPNIHNMAAAGSGEGFDASKVLSPILAQGIFQVIGSTDYRNYHCYIEPRSDFANNFDLVKVEELDEKASIEVLATQAKIIEYREGIVMTYGALKKAVELSKRYIADRLLPGKAIDLLSETAVEVRRMGAGSILRDKDVMEVITEKTGIPLIDVTAKEAEKLLNLEENLHQRVIGQSEAVKAISAAIRRVRVGMKHKDSPIGTFLFLGPTGVGKTELAKALAEAYYGDENAMIRLDMSEYQTVASVEKLIGSSVNISESGSGGVLTEAIKRKPFSLILLDELEKANKNVLNLFLQVFDDGRLTDNLGRTVNFTNTIIIATSNAGSQVIRKIVVDKKSSNARMIQVLEPYLLKSFAPEFLNRFTAKIIFKSLSPKEIIAIARLQIKNLSKRLDEAQKIQISISDKALEKLADLGYSPEYGARFLQRTIQEKIENMIATKFLKGEIKKGDVFRIEEGDI
ncbi:MAG: ATP-dependent Clp protease ATP-binding subunit [Candidatus Pacebacteria bacterium]|nr:ATP-dependent Clp protease ATP-binding subunit [Candidatus Paceibacterota bacterium]